MREQNKMFDPTDLSVERWNSSSPEDRKRIDWHRDWNDLKDTEREFLLLIFSDLLDHDKSKIKPVQRCINSAFITAFKKGYLEEQACSRCGGGGHYSWNRVHGSMCYGCNGTGIERPRITKKLIQTLTNNIKKEVK